MATQFEGNGSFLANAAVSAFRGVTISNNRGVGASATAVIPDGLVQRDADSGDYVAVKFFSGPGTQKISITGAPVTVGDFIYAGANGQATKTGGTVTMGKSLTTTATNGDIIEFVPVHKLT